MLQKQFVRSKLARTNNAGETTWSNITENKDVAGGRMKLPASESLQWLCKADEREHVLW